MAELAPWLAQPADPIGNFLKGTQAGGIIAGVRQRQQALNQDAQMNEMRMREVAIDLKSKAANYDYAMQQRAAEADLASAYSAIGQLDNGWANPDAYRVMSAVGVKHPAIIGSPIWTHGQENIFKAKTLENQTKQIESMESLRKSQAHEDEMRAAKEEAQAYDIGLGEEGGSTAIGRNTRLLDTAQSSVEDATNAFNDAETPEEKLAAQKMLEQAESHLAHVQAFIPHANEAIRMKHQEKMAAYGAQKQRILSELKRLDSAIMKKSDKEVKRESLEAELLGLEEKYFPTTPVEAPSKFDHQPDSTPSPAFGAPISASGQQIFKTRDEVSAAFNAGKLTKEEAVTILNEKFGMPKAK